MSKLWSGMSRSCHPQLLLGSGMHCVGLPRSAERSHLVTCPGPMWIASHSGYSMLQWAVALVIVFQVDDSLSSPYYKCCSFCSRQTCTEFLHSWSNCVFPLHFSLFKLRNEIVNSCPPPVTRDSRDSLPSSVRWKQSQNIDFCALPPVIFLLGVHALWCHSSLWQCCVHFWYKILGKLINLKVWLITFPKWVPPPV